MGLTFASFETSAGGGRSPTFRIDSRSDIITVVESIAIYSQRHVACLLHVAFAQLIQKATASFTVVSDDFVQSFVIARDQFLPFSRVAVRDGLMVSVVSFFLVI